MNKVKRLSRILVGKLDDQHRTPPAMEATQCWILEGFGFLGLGDTMPGALERFLEENRTRQLARKC